MVTKIGTTILFSALAVIVASPYGAAQAGSGIVPPRAIYAPAPEYSEQARKANFQGTCVLRVLVGADGAVHEVRVERPLGMGLNEKAVEAVRIWRFRPALKNGSPVAHEIHIEVSFRLGVDNDAQQAFLNAVPPPVDFPISITVKPCQEPVPRADEQSKAPTTMVTVVDLTFEGATQVPIEEQDRIAASIKSREFNGPPKVMGDDVLEFVRQAWQDRGYFKVQVNGDSKVLTSNAVSSRIAVTAHVDEGEQYRLGGITFSGNKGITNTQVLRDLFRIKDGEVFSRTKFAEGLDNLKKAYETQGYINFTSVPNPSFDEDARTVSFEIDVDEGKQFTVSAINLIGVDENALDGASKDLYLNVGQLYNQNLLDVFGERHPFGGSNSLTAFLLNEREGTVAVTLDLRHCGVQ